MTSTRYVVCASAVSLMNTTVASNNHPFGQRSQPEEVLFALYTALQDFHVTAHYSHSSATGTCLALLEAVQRSLCSAVKGSARRRRVVHHVADAIHTVLWIDLTKQQLCAEPLTNIMRIIMQLAHDLDNHWPRGVLQLRLDTLNILLINAAEPPVKRPTWTFQQGQFDPLPARLSTTEILFPIEQLQHNVHNIKHLRDMIAFTTPRRAGRRVWRRPRRR